MREILFRGKGIYTNEWHEGFLYIGTSGACEILETHEYFAVIPETVGQYTGLTDKNGIKIFEGDIVEYNDGYDYFKGEVTFENGAFGIGCDEIIGISNGCSDNFANLWQLFWNQEVTDEPMLYYCSVIGNIYDDPKLLER